jgi:SAM-dependent methyltransferase
MNTMAPDSGSFRDRDGRIYHQGDRVFRGLSDGALQDFRTLEAKPFYRSLLEQGCLVGSRELPLEETPLPGDVKQQWAGFIEHDRIPVITYPYEWTFGMLRDAALLQLELVEAALLEGMALKDATPYNIQFVNGRPLFIDIASFETPPEGAPWTGYRQFCEMFLFPLMLQAYKGVDFQPFLRAGIDGVAVQTAASLFGFRDRFRSGVGSHVWLQAKLESRYGSTQQNVRSDLKSAGFNKEMILANVRKMRKLVGKLDWRGDGSEWGHYEEFHNYSEGDHDLKETFIADCVASAKADLVWDIGCNTGQFSKIAASRGATVLAMDLDHFAVERLYREVRSEGIEGILPIVQNVSDPSPSWGWRNLERTNLFSRAKPDLVLCLALIHHVVISANIPLDEFIEWLSEVTEQLVIEYVSRSDDKVKTLLRNKEDKYSDYSRKRLEQALKRRFGVLKRQSLTSGNRHLYYCTRT